MYRKYAITKTHVLNSHNYLIEAQLKDNNQAVLFHQILLAAEVLPALVQHKNMENYISQSENQNVVNELRERLEVYFEQNLLQIRIKSGVRLISQVSKLPFLGLMGAINAMNIDYAIATKQLVANSKHQQMECLNNCSRFHSTFLMQEESNQVIIPFLEQQQSKMHYYDIYFDGLFAKHEGKSCESEGLKVVGLKSKLKNQRTGKILREDQSFRKYVMFLVVMLSCDSVVELLQEIKRIAAGESFLREIKNRMERIVSASEQYLEKGLIDLLGRCLQRSEQYNINIFKKECQLLVERYQKMRDGSNQGESHHSAKSSILTKKEDKIWASKSLIDRPKSQVIGQVERGRSLRRQSGHRLKNSKSQINLSKSGDNRVGRGKVKKATLNIFKDSKIELKSSTSCILRKGLNRPLQKNKLNNSSCDMFGQSFQFDKMPFATSEWFNMATTQESNLCGQLRNFKRANLCSSSHQTPVRRSSKEKEMFPSQKNVSKCQEIVLNTGGNETDVVGEEELSRFSKISNKSKAILQRKGETNQKDKENKNSISLKQKILQDQFIMTEGSKWQQELNDKGKDESSHTRIKTSTLNISFYDEGKKKNDQKENDAKSTPKCIEKSAKKASAANEETMVRRQGKGPEKGGREMSKTKEQQEIVTGVTISKIFSNIKDINNEDIEQIQEIDLKNTKLSQLIQNSSKKPLSLVQSDSPTIKRNNRQKESDNVKKGVILSQVQKTFYVKHFELVLKFCNEHKASITSLPNSSNLTYLINFIYYKTLLENSNSQNNTIYNKLVGLIDKKQQKFMQEQRDNYLMFRVSADSLWGKAKKLRHLEKNLNANIEEFFEGHEEIDCMEELGEFLAITQEGCELIGVLVDEMYNYMQTNKVLLINKGAFGVLLQLGYLLTIIRIMSLQRLKYYCYLQQGSFWEVLSVFQFTFKESEEEYVKQYRRELGERSLSFVSVKEEYEKLSQWVSQYK